MTRFRLAPDRCEGARSRTNPSGKNAALPSFESKLAWFVRLRELVGSG